ncbi:bifunctional 2-keto-4-hydroxyglutarate aldolase/2-keto-3-deoxy-6-phosphogluconate aldolase [Salinicoccus roseus]|uniref:2-dehydro-3-deoxyphosphogluconate aldolase n=1 Tax=Salinicoccus roseus TaxID=45670 RepID=A0A265E766_9STAP|nr:bifunctional 2-keto-4-hydroxyglutarate aldolase/2-keto-3-deoxy-6-phosphogluconate aldolase [Salinicoccus roseus]OZT77441.1 2-dehydro-3-deoxyphosphogluconate aldolase [Salinicoccus roseus]RPE52931.1 2-keto-3-deoxy-phosphogluconate aldolase [Salinicoccus roseus]GGA72173.1 2-dehydro-3-deoxy-phosphogluconate aldolase [Salinicoccus roseus]
MKKFDVLNEIRENYLIAVVRGKGFEDTVKMVENIIEGGIKNIEITYTTPKASELIEHFATNSEACVGAGTVMSRETADEAIRRGAQYIVSPHFDKDVAALCNLNQIPYLPGCATATEVAEAMKAGVDVIKIFPGGVLGASFIKDIKGPMPHANLMPSGGVNKENMADWMENGAFAIGIGSALAKGYDGSNPEVVKENTESFVATYQKALKGE